MKNLKTYIFFSLFCFLTILSVEKLEISEASAAVINNTRIFTLGNGDSLIDTIKINQYNTTGSFAYSLFIVGKTGTINSSDSILAYGWEMRNVNAVINNTFYGFIADRTTDSTLLYDRSVVTSTLMPKQTLVSKVNSGGFVIVVKFRNADSGDTVYVARDLETATNNK